MSDIDFVQELEQYCKIFGLSDLTYDVDTFHQYEEHWYCVTVNMNGDKHPISYWVVRFGDTQQMAARMLLNKIKLDIAKFVQDGFTTA